MGSAKAWYFAALGVAALSLSSSGGRCLFDQASGAAAQFRAKTLPYVAMLEMTLNRPQNSPQVQATAARVQEKVAQVEAQRACAEATMARIQAMKDRMQARAGRQAADWDEAAADDTFVIADHDWARVTATDAVVARQVAVANRALARVQEWKDSGKFIAPYVRFTPNRIVVEGPQRVIVAPGGNVHGRPIPARVVDPIQDPI